MITRMVCLITAFDQTLILCSQMRWLGRPLQDGPSFDAMSLSRSPLLTYVSPLHVLLEVKFNVNVDFLQDFLVTGSVAKT